MLTKLQGLDIGTVAVVVALVAAASTATAFYFRLRGNVIALQKQLERLEEHPMLVFYKNWLTSRGTAAFFDDILKSREDENE
ncbi:MAG: hypothetical protein WA667_20845 [Candidatus Nitrosopolaris sp.]